MSKVTNQNKQKTTKQSTATVREVDYPRRLQKPKRIWYKPRSWRLAKPNYAHLSKARHILVYGVRMAWQSKKPVGGITLVYELGIIVLVRGILSNQDFTTIKNLLDSLLTGSGGKIESTGLQLLTLFGGTGSVNTSNGGLYQMVLIILCSLALIWVFRQAHSKKPVTTKQAFYEGMYPIIPFLGVLIFVALQLLPLTLSSYLYRTLISNGVAVLGIEQFISFIVIIGLALWSLRMLTSSIFAFYIVTLPGMTPMRALRSAKNLVPGRRLLIWRKIIFLPLALMIVTSLAMLPFLLFLTPVVVWVFFVFSTFWFVISHAYLYTLYRELIKDA
jgi:hypothetical protein